MLRLSFHFNPHTREGCDLSSCVTSSRRSNFNPHTREGCDVIRPLPSASNAHFNPHTREGCDTSKGQRRLMERISIHTPARGVTCQYIHQRGIPCHISIHTPARGVTSLLSCYVLLNPISIHTPARGVTTTDRGELYGGEDFNPHTREGCDMLLPDQPRHRERISIHTPARGVTHLSSDSGVSGNIFQSTHPRGV